MENAIFLGFGEDMHRRSNIRNNEQLEYNYNHSINSTTTRVQLEQEYNVQPVYTIEYSKQYEITLKRHNRVIVT